MAEPLTLSAVKTNLKIEFPDDDDLITQLIVDAREYVEGETGLVLTPRTVTETARSLGAYIELASWPVQGVTAVRYPIAGAMTALAPGSWLTSLSRRPVRLLPALPGWGVNAWAGAGYYGSPSIGWCPTWPGLPVEIDVVAGYLAPTAVPARATRAMHLLIGHWYQNRLASEVGMRAAAIEVPFGVKNLLSKLKLRRLG